MSIKPSAVKMIRFCVITCVTIVSSNNMIKSFGIVRSFFIAMNYKDSKWNNKRNAILKRDKYQCQECRRYGKMIDASHVHHIWPVEFYPEYKYSNWNLISLCQKCHNKMHDRDSHELTTEGLRLQSRHTPPGHTE